MNSIITGTGSCIPERVVTNADFMRNGFYNDDQTALEYDNEKIIEKFEAITGIRERRYIKEDQTSSEIATRAAEIAIADAGVDPESLDYIILAHNFGDVRKHTIQTDVLPGLAARVKHNLGIANPRCVAYDILFGCPGWIQSLIQGHIFIQAGEAKKVLVIGTETLSRVVDPHDRDAMIFADGAGACILEAKKEDERRGILSHRTLTHTVDEAYYLAMGKSNSPESDPRVRYIKMEGRKIYEYALTEVPAAMKECYDASGEKIEDLEKIFIHQANEKMDEAIVKRFYRLYKVPMEEKVLPMNIHTLGNSSVATVPTLFDQVKRGNLGSHKLYDGEIILFASVGAGMHINAVTYIL
ncbi:MAG: ketoacyl-ACP synthase III [Flavobacteriales bacterium]|nr:ketoacyl-ACP synthase III [Flavobacteriales bacterium]